MTLWIATDHWLVESEGRLLPTHGSVSTRALRRYLDTGLAVCLLARVREDLEPASSELHDPRLTVRPLGRDSKRRPFWWRCLLLVVWLWRVPVRRGDVVVVRLPELVGTSLALVARARGAAVVANVVAEPRAVSRRFGGASRAVDLALVRVLRSVVARAAATVYVTRRWLQDELPPPAHRPTLTASNVALGRDDVVPVARDFVARPLTTPLVLVAVGDQHSPSKGHDVLVRACRRLAEEGVPTLLHLLGDGVEHEGLVALAEAEGVAATTTFHGFVHDRAALRRLVDAADVFVMPSRTEGLPRALVEAQVRGVCCIGSRVGGIPELLPDAALFEPDDVEDLVRCVRSLLDGGGADLTRMVEEELAGGRWVVENADSPDVTRLISGLAQPAAERRGAP